MKTATSFFSPDVKVKSFSLTATPLSSNNLFSEVALNEYVSA